MFRVRPIQLFVVPVITVFLGACSQESISMDRGKLIYSGGGNTLTEVSFNESNVSKQTLYRIGGVHSGITAISYGEKDEIIFTECHLNEGCYIKSMKITTAKVEHLRSGRNATYIPGKEKILFYDVGNDGVERLYLADIADIYSKQAIARAPSPVTLRNGVRISTARQPVVMGGSKVAIVDEERRLVEFDVDTGTSNRVLLKNHRPLAWLEATEELLAAEHIGETVVAVQPATGKVREVEGVRSSHSLIRGPDGDTVIYGRTDSRYFLLTEYNAYLFNTRNGVENLLISGAMVDHGVYFASPGSE